jgi:hypothetical protein
MIFPPLSTAWSMGAAVAFVNRWTQVDIVSDVAATCSIVRSEDS